VDNQEEDVCETSPTRVEDSNQSSNRNSPSCVLACDELTKQYQQGPQTLTVLDRVSLGVQPADSVAIVGSSGSGKTTLLHLLAGLDRPTSGQVYWQNKPIDQLSEAQLGQMRNRSIGFVYQFHHLMPEFSAWENVALPLLLGSESTKVAQSRARALLDRVGLSHRAGHRPSELSGGERQRVAIARALVTEPVCVLADEPTGNLDVDTSESVQSLLLELNQTLSVALILVTHDQSFAQRCARQVRLDHGVLTPT